MESTAVKFFVPYAKDEEHAQRLYNAICNFAMHNMGWKIKDTKIFSIKYGRDSKGYIAEVGKYFKPIRETVVAIIEGDVYMVCSENWGVKRGEPFFIGHNEVTSIINFN